MKPIHILLAIVTIAFIVTLGVLAYRDRQEPSMVFMTEAEAFAFVEKGGI